MKVRDALHAAVLGATTFVAGEASAPEGTSSFESKDTESVIGERMRFDCDHRRTLMVHAGRIRGKLRITINGTTFGVRNDTPLPDTTFNEILDNVSLRSDMLALFSKDHGTVNISRDCAVSVFDELATSYAQSIPVQIPAQFIPKEGSATALAVGARNWLYDIDGSEPQLYAVTFERLQPEPATFAMNRPSR